METFTALKVLHSVATVLLLGSALAVAIGFWRGRRGGNLPPPRSTLFPYTTLFGSSVLYTFGCLAWVWLVVRLNRLRRGEAGGHWKFTLTLAIFSTLCFVGIAALMGAKPV